MADFYPLIARAIGRLEKNTEDARHAVYEHARATLVDHLRNVNPPLTKSEIVRLHFILEEAILAAESDVVRLQASNMQNSEEPAARPAIAAEAIGEQALRYDPILQIMSAAHAAISRYHVFTAQNRSLA